MVCIKPCLCVDKTMLCGGSNAWHTCLFMDARGCSDVNHHRTPSTISSLFIKSSGRYYWLCGDADGPPHGWLPIRLLTECRNVYGNAQSPPLACDIDLGFSPHSVHPRFPVSRRSSAGEKTPNSSDSLNVLKVHHAILEE